MSFSSILGSIDSGLSAVSKLGSLGSGITSLFGSQSSARKAMDRWREQVTYSSALQKQLMDYQNDINVQNWNMQNAYNSPSAQVQRYKDAGLNTSLIYGGSGAVSGNAETVASPSGSSLSSGVDGKVSSGLMAKQMAQQSALVASQISLNQSQANKNNAEADQVAPNSESQRAVNSSTIEVNSARISEIFSGIQENIANIANLSADTDNKRAMLKGLRVESDIKELGMDYTLEKMKFESLNQEIQFDTALKTLNEILPLDISIKEKLLTKTSWEITELMSRCHLNYTQAQYALAQVTVCASIAALNKSQTALNETTGKYLGEELASNITQLRADILKKCFEGYQLANGLNFNGFLPYIGSMLKTTFNYAFGDQSTQEALQKYIDSVFGLGPDSTPLYEELPEGETVKGILSNGKYK